MAKKNEKVLPESNVITQDDKENQIKCERVNLKSCGLNFVPTEKAGDQKLQFSLNCRVFENLLLSELQIRMVNDFPENDQFSQVLQFQMVGVFSSGKAVSKENLGNFGKHYTLSILWPYAREFSQDLLQRTGFSWKCLPIVNAQETTKEMIENNSITVEFTGSQANQVS